MSITDVSAEWPSVGEVVRTLTLNAGHNSAVVVIAATLLGIAAGIVGGFALLRKRAMMGDCLAHCTLPGIAGAYLIVTMFGGEGRSLPLLLLGAAVTGVLGVLAVQGIVRSTRLREDAAMASVLSVFFGLGILLLSYIQGLRTGNQGGLSHFIYGQTAAMQVADAYVMAAVAGVVVIAAGLLFKEFRVVCFDDRYAATQGLRVGAIDMVMMTLVVAVTVIGLQAVGLMLIVALLIIPAAAARFWTDRLIVMTILSGAIGGLSGYLGSCASALLPRMPAGAVIVLAAGTLFLVSLLASPRRGVLAAAVRRGRLRLRIATEHYLRTTYELLESGQGPASGASMSLSRIGRARGWTSAAALALTWLLAGRGLLRRDGESVRLTEFGLAEATRITRNHRLWEQFLVGHAHLAVSHVDRSADMVEHALSPVIVAELEEALRGRGMLPTLLPGSVHPINGAGGLR
jgi:manganese/zinc/iron transport system permease protein